MIKNVAMDKLNSALSNLLDAFKTLKQRNLSLKNEIKTLKTANNELNAKMINLQAKYKENDEYLTSMVNNICSLIENSDLDIDTISAPEQNSVTYSQAQPNTQNEHQQIQDTINQVNDEITNTNYDEYDSTDNSTDDLLSFIENPPVNEYVQSSGVSQNDLGRMKNLLQGNSLN